MKHILALIAAIVLLRAEAFGEQAGQGSPKPAQSILPYASIFLADVRQASATAWEPARGSERRSVAVRVHAPRILKDDKHQGLTAGDFNTELQQLRWAGGVIRDNPYFWSDREIAAGQQYVVFSNLSGELSAMFAAPDMAELVSGNDEIVADLELILASSTASMQQQAEAVTRALRESAKPRSHFIVEYGAALLAAGPDQQTAALADAMANSSTLRLSDGARAALPASLFHQSRTVENAPDNLLRTFVSVTARYFSASDQPPTGLTPMHVEILQNYVPLIRSLPRATAAMRALPPSLLDPLRKRAVALAADTRLSPEQRTSVRELLAIVNAR